MPTPFKSKAQMERCKRLVAEGVLTQKQFDEQLAATPHHEGLPERLHPKKEKGQPSGDDDGGKTA